MYIEYFFFLDVIADLLQNHVYQLTNYSDTQYLHSRLSVSWSSQLKRIIRIQDSAPEYPEKCHIMYHLSGTNQE